MALGDAIVALVDVEGLARDVGAGSNEKAGVGAWLPVIFALDAGFEANVDVNANVRAETAEVLPEKDGGEGGSGDAGGLGGDIGAQIEGGRASFFVFYGDEEDGAVGVGIVVADGVVGVITAVRTDPGEEGFDLPGIDRLIQDGLEDVLDIVREGRRGSFDFDLEDGAGGRAFFGTAMGEIGGPVGVVQGVLEEFGLVSFSGIIAAPGEHIGFEVVVGAKAFDLGNDEDVGELACLGFVGLNADGKGALKNAEDGIKVAFADRLERKADGDNHVGLHGAHLGRGQVRQDGSIDVFMTGELKRLEDAGDGSRGAHGIRE